MKTIIYIVTWSILSVNYSSKDIIDEFGRYLYTIDEATTHKEDKQKGYFNRDSALAFYNRAMNAEPVIMFNSTVQNVAIDSLSLEQALDKYGSVTAVDKLDEWINY